MQAPSSDAQAKTKSPRRSRHAHGAIGHVDALLEWIGEARDPVLRLLEALDRQNDPDANLARQAWSGLVRAHAKDICTTAKSSAAPGFERELSGAIDILVSLVHGRGAMPQKAAWSLHALGLCLKVSPSPIKIDDAFPQSVLRATNLEEAIKAYPDNQCLRDAAHLCDVIPSADLPTLALATGALLVVGALGTLEDLPLMVAGTDPDWHAALVRVQ